MMNKMMKMMPKPARKMMAKMPGPFGKRARKLKKKREDERAAVGTAAPSGAEWDKPVGMKHGGVVRASDKAKKNRAWSNRG